MLAAPCANCCLPSRPPFALLCAKLQWAAFFSDCVHEVLPVTAGTRVSLAYEVFAHHGGCAAYIFSTSLLSVGLWHKSHWLRRGPCDACSELRHART